MSRQDLQNMLDSQKRWLFDRLLAKNDYLTFSGQFRDKIINQQYLWHQTTHQLVKQILAMETQHHQRGQALETRISALEAEIRNLQHSLAAVLAEVQASRKTPEPTQPEQRRGWLKAFENPA